MKYRVAVSVGSLALLAALVFIFLGRRFQASAPPPPPPVPVFTAPAREVVVANLGDHSILGFEIGPTRTIAPTPGRIIQGPLTGLQNPVAVALDKDDNGARIWVANLGARAGFPDAEPSITVYASDANGNVAPVLTISPRGGFAPGFIQPSAIAWRFNPPNLFMANGQSTYGDGNVLEYSEGQRFSTGSIDGAQTQLATPSGIALDASGRLYVAEPKQNAIRVFDRLVNQSINTPPIASISGPATALDNPAHITIDARDRLYVVNRGSDLQGVENASITVYSAGAIGNVGPSQRIFGPSSLLVQPYGIGVDREFRVYVSDFRRLIVFSAGANGNARPDQVIRHPSFNSPAGLAVR